MDVQGWTFLIVGLSFALYIGIAIWSRAGSTKDFYVAGGGVPPLANGMATAADWMSEGWALLISPFYVPQRLPLELLQESTSSKQCLQYRRYPRGAEEAHSH